MNVTVLINGERRTVADDTSVRDLIATISGTSDAGASSGVAVAIDDRVVPRSEWDLRIHDGARVEILTAVQGG